MLYTYIKIIHQWFTSRRHKSIKQNENAVRGNLETHYQDPLLHPVILAMNERQRADLPLHPQLFEDETKLQAKQGSPKPALCQSFRLENQ